MPPAVRLGTAVHALYERAGKGLLPPDEPALRAAPGVRFGGPARVSRQDRGRDSGCTPRSDMAHGDAAGVNGGNRIPSHGAPPGRLMPDGCLGSPVLVLLRS